MPRRNDLTSILVIGSGPIVIGQACEFDYSGTQACRVLAEEGYRVILANSNPATIMTDPGHGRPHLRRAARSRGVRARSSRRSGRTRLLPTLGGQTALNLTMQLRRTRRASSATGSRSSAPGRRRSPPPRIGTSSRPPWRSIGLEVPRSGFAHSLARGRGDRRRDRVSPSWCGPASSWAARAPVSPRTRPASRSWRPRAWPPARWARSWSRSPSPGGRSSNSR